MRPFSPNVFRALRPLSTKPTSLTSTRPLSTKLTGPRSLTRATIPSIQPRFLIHPAIRHNSASPLTSDPTRTETDEERQRQNEERRKNEEAYKISFTCKPCGERSTHRISKQGYHRGTILIQCPSCKNRHVISDHLGIFFDKGTTLEDLLKEKGQAVTHGVTDGDMEFWDDGTVKSSPLKPKEESS